MKEATGELNMTVIVIIAIAAVLALFWAFLWPAISSGLKGNTCKSWTDGNGKAYHYVKTGDKEGCCPANIDVFSTAGGNGCVEIEKKTTT